VGLQALTANTIGVNNVAIGQQALATNTTGFNNVALGDGALFFNINGALNTAVGSSALSSITTGSSNIGLGEGAGANYTGGENGNICIGNGGVNGESITTRIGTAQTRTFIAGIRGATTGIADAVAVLIDSAGQLGTINSRRSVKHNIQDMAADSTNIYNLRPVTFVYNGDASETQQYGLIAEEVAQVFPGIVVYDPNGEPYTVQYQVLPVLLLNEMQKQQEFIKALAEDFGKRIADLEARA